MKRNTAVLAMVAVTSLATFVWSTTPVRAQGGNVVVLTGDITESMELKKKKTYILQGGVFLRSGVKLKIKAGTTIFGDTGSFLVIDKGAKLIAKGTASNPIVFTSIQPPGQRRRGDWGGLIFNGNAPINIPGGIAEGEGGTGQYGGPDPDDNQGKLSYVRVEYGGFPISPDNELNCIAFQGTGRGTRVEFIEALNGGDDGIEFFGGTVDVKHLVVVGANDDSIDWTFGWIGRIQFALVQQRADGPSQADRGIEADNNETDFELLPRSNPQIANLTLVGDPDPTFSGSTLGMDLRRGTGAQLRNVVVTGFKNVGIRISDAATYSQFDSGGITLRGIIFFDNKSGSNFESTTRTALESKGLGSQQILDQVDPQLVNPFSRTAPDFRPASGSPALSAENVAPPFADSFFEAASYVGAFDAVTDWTAGWTNYESPAN
jgi:hypothetical protein